MSAAGPSQGANCTPSGGSAATESIDEAASVGAVRTGAQVGAVDTSGVLVIAVGNRSRGDDAIGPLLLDRLAARLAPDGGERDIELIEDYQLQVEHALDLAGRRLVLFVDAGTGTPAPYTFEEVAPAAPSASHTTHALAPPAVLGCYRQVTGDAPPPAFVLCVHGERFELGEAPSADASANAEVAWQLLMRLCAEADAERWRALAKAGSSIAKPRPTGAGVSATR